MRFAQTATVPRHWLYAQVLTIVFLLAKGSEETVIRANMHVSEWGTEVRLVPSPFGPGSQLKYKNAVRALYEACFAVSEYPCRTPVTISHVPRLYDGLYLQNQIIGFLQGARWSGPFNRTY